MGVAFRVLRSIEDAIGQRCVDLVIEDGRFGWCECRRDPEDGHGWQRLGGLPISTHPTQEAALDEARDAVPWLSEAL